MKYFENNKPYRIKFNQKVYFNSSLRLCRCTSIIMLFFKFYDYNIIISGKVIIFVLYKPFSINISDMKILILNALKAKFLGVSEAVLNRIADKLAKTVTKEDDVAAAVEAVTFQQVIDSESDRRATEATNTAIVNYEKKHSLKEGKPVTGGGQGNDDEPAGGKEPPQGGDLASQISAAVKAAVSPLMQEIETLKSGKVSDTRKQQLDTVIANASDKFKTRITNNYGRMSFKDDEDYAAWLEEIKAEAEEDAAESTASGAVFGRPKFGQPAPKDEVPKHIQDYLDGKDKAEGQAF